MTSCEKCKFIIYHPHIPSCKCCAPTMKHEEFNYYKGRRESFCKDVAKPNCKHFVKSNFIFRMVRIFDCGGSDKLVGYKIREKLKDKGGV